MLPVGALCFYQAHFGPRCFQNGHFGRLFYCILQCFRVWEGMLLPGACRMSHASARRIVSCRALCVSSLCSQILALPFGPSEICCGRKGCSSGGFHFLMLSVMEIPDIKMQALSQTLSVHLSPQTSGKGNMHTSGCQFSQKLPEPSLNLLAPLARGWNPSFFLSHTSLQTSSTHVYTLRKTISALTLQFPDEMRLLIAASSHKSWPPPAGTKARLNTFSCFCFWWEHFLLAKREIFTQEPWRP